MSRGRSLDRGRTVKLIRLLVAVVGLCVAGTACDRDIKDKENLLAASGFKATPLRSPAQQASFKTLPAHKLTRKVHTGKTFWVYPDPTICACLYIGDQAAYNRYQQKQAAISAADFAALNGRDNPTNFDFSPWVADPYN
jgi:hypothetical protein